VSDDPMMAKIADLEAKIADLVDRVTRLEAGRDLDQQNQRTALDRIAKATEELLRLEKRR
jgi:hypothetical protein